jgi:hypothetical protein
MGHDGVAVTPGNSNEMTPLATRGCVRGALLLTLALACASGAARAQSGEPLPSTASSVATSPVSSTGSSAAPAASAGPQQAVPQSSLPVALPPQPPAPGAAQAPPPAEKRGFFDEVSRWWRDSVADFNTKFKEQQSKIDDFNKKSAEAAKDAATATQQAMKNAADAMVKSATSKVIEIHAPCAVAGNGAADCASAAADACKGKGFSDGQPLDVRTAEKCNASLWLQGQGQQRSANAECPIETVVLRAACQ